MSSEKKIILKENWWIFAATGSTPLVCALALYLNPYLVPLVCVLPAYPVMLMLLRRKQRAGAVAFMIAWAMLLGISMTLLIYALPDEAKAKILNGENYRSEMMEWVLTGVGREGNPFQFIPYHIVEACIFVVLSLCTGSLVSIIMGAFLMNYMSYYVANLALMGDNPWLLILGWHPWSVIRVISYVIMGVIFSEPLLSKLLKYRYSFAQVKKLLYTALGLWIIDLVIKTLLADTWQQLLKSGIGAGN